MLGLANEISPRFSWSQIESALLAVPLEHFKVAARAGLTEEDGLKRARAMLADDLRRALEAHGTPSAGLDGVTNHE